MEGAPKREEGEVDQSRRSFLSKGLTALGVAAAATAGVSYLASEKKEGDDEEAHPDIKKFLDGAQKESLDEIARQDEEVPYATPVEQLTHEELLKEIVHDVSRVQMLEQFRDRGVMSGDSTLLDYFLKRSPSKEEIAIEITTLHNRIADLRTYRDSHKPL